MKDVTVLTPFHRRGDLTKLKRTCGSVDGQTSGDWHHIVVTNGIEPPAKSWVEGHTADGRRSVYAAVEGPYNTPCPLFMEVLQYVTTEYVILLNIGDILFPDCLEQGMSKKLTPDMVLQPFYARIVEPDSQAYSGPHRNLMLVHGQPTPFCCVLPQAIIRTEYIKARGFKNADRWDYGTYTVADLGEYPAQVAHTYKPVGLTLHHGWM